LLHHRRQNEALEQPNIAQEVEQYVALGGPLGGGFAAPPVDTNAPDYDWTAPFRERVGMCSRPRPRLCHAVLYW
jgi:hypothetical protein